MGARCKLAGLSLLDIVSSGRVLVEDDNDDDDGGGEADGINCCRG